MGKSGSKTDAFTKAYQKSEGKSPTVTYRSNDCGVKATITAGGNEYNSRSFASKDEARNEAIDMAISDMRHIISNDDDDE